MEHVREIAKRVIIEYSFDKRETATLIHSLRLFQETLTPYNEPCTVAGEDCDHFTDTPPLTAEEIDLLCERLNLGVEKNQPPPAHASDCARRFHPASECTCGFIADEDQPDNDGDWIHVNGFYGCSTDKGPSTATFTAQTTD